MAYSQDTYAGGHVAALDLQQIEDNFEYLRTNFKGAAAPADPGGGLEGLVWWDSSNKTFKGRSDSEWRGIFSGNASFKIWAYLDTVPDGWTRDTTVTDEVLAFKGGSTYTTGATRDKGSWTISNISSGGHALTAAEMPVHDHNVYGVSGTGGAAGVATGTGFTGVWIDYIDDAGSGNSHEHTGGSNDGAWRIKAAVGIMLYPKL